jgi:Flp pilus assembly pilin Flp
LHPRHYYSVWLIGSLALCEISDTGTEQSEDIMIRALGRLWKDEGQDVAEYAVMLAVILAVVVGTIRLIGSGANNVFSSVGSSIQ